MPDIAASTGIFNYLSKGFCFVLLIQVVTHNQQHFQFSELTTDWYRSVYCIIVPFLINNWTQSVPLPQLQAGLTNTQFPIPFHRLSLNSRPCSVALSAGCCT